MIDKQTRRHVRTLYTDNDLKFYNDKFNKNYMKEGIICHHIVPHTLQYNEIAEMMNHPILERV